MPALPNLKDIPKRFVDPRGLGVFVSAQILGITCNTERVKNPPKSWNDLLRPEGLDGRTPLPLPAGAFENRCNRLRRPLQAAAAADAVDQPKFFSAKLQFTSELRKVSTNFGRALR